MSEQEVFTLAEARQFLRIGRTALFGLLKDGAIPFIRQGSRRYCLRSDLIKYLDVRRVGGSDAA
jgi:hypothetical protein